MAFDDGACPGHVWVLAEIGETRGRLDIASTCSVCGALHDELGVSRPPTRLPEPSRLGARQ
jgi:hypothetical protein